MQTHGLVMQKKDGTWRVVFERHDRHIQTSCLLMSRVTSTASLDGVLSVDSLAPVEMAVFENILSGRNIHLNSQWPA